MSLLARLAEAFAAASPIHDGRQLGDLHHMAAWPIGASTMEAEKTCKTCRWWQPVGVETQGPCGEISGVIRTREDGSVLRWWLGKCHIRAPKPTFPMTACHDWCGEHSPKEEAK